MLKHTSVRSSMPQVRNPVGLRHLPANSGFQKTLTNLLEPIPLPFPTFQFVKETSQSILDKHTFYAWKRPSKLRSQFIVLSDLLPPIIVDPRDHSKASSLKFPVQNYPLQKVGPIILEGSYDTQEYTLWIWDVLVWEKAEIWSTHSYSKRWDILLQIYDQILQPNHALCEINIKLPSWISLQQCILEGVPEKEYSVEFQPEKAGQRRFLWNYSGPKQTFIPTTYHERAMVAKEAEVLQKKIEEKQVQEKQVQETQPQVQEKQVQEKKMKQYVQQCVATLSKDKLSKLPDTYKATNEKGEDLGIVAIRNMAMSKSLRETFQVNQVCKVELQWYEQFQKYEVKKILT